MNPYHVMTLTRHKSVQSFRRYTRLLTRQRKQHFMKLLKGDLIAATQPITTMMINRPVEERKFNSFRHTYTIRLLLQGRSDSCSTVDRHKNERRRSGFNKSLL